MNPEMAFRHLKDSLRDAPMREIDALQIASYIQDLIRVIVREEIEEMREDYAGSVAQNGTDEQGSETAAGQERGGE